MLLRGILAGTALLWAVALAVPELHATPEAIGRDSTSPQARESETLRLRPFSLGTPAAASLYTMPPTPSLLGMGNETDSPAPLLHSRPVSAKSGDTLAGMLVGAGVPQGEAIAAIDALKPLFDPRRIKIGQDLSIDFERDSPIGEDPGRFVGFVLDVDYAREILVARTTTGDFSAEEKEKRLAASAARVQGEIRSNLFLDAREAGLPLPVLIDLIRAFSWDVDFQRDLQPGDRFELMYDVFYDDSGTLVHNGEIQYAAMTLSGIRRAIYRFEDKDGFADYFDEKGRSARKALMRTPIDGARLSSRYGKRKHPILGYTRMHRGVDFAAPIGTPIYAAGDGSIDRIGRNGGFDKYIRIRHNSEYATAYGHLSRYAKGLRKGDRVKQGQVIGYVGNTGRSTGPHLHYEILRGGSQVNPMTVRMPSGRSLKGEELVSFQKGREELDRRFAELALDIMIAGED